MHLASSLVHDDDDDIVVDIERRLVVRSEMQQ